MKTRSRLKSHNSKKALTHILISVAGLIIGVLLLIQFGLPFLGFVSLLFSNKKDPMFTENKLVYIAPPLLEQSFQATNSAQINLTGTADPNLTISLYVNDTLIDKTTVKKNRKFTFEQILLTEGENTIKVKAADEKEKESDFSQPIHISYLVKEPDLTIDQPQENERFPKDFNRIVIKGKTNKNVKITVNEQWAIVDSEGNFTYDLLLHDGDNILKITAIDDAGNKKEIERKVTYAP